MSGDRPPYSDGPQEYRQGQYPAAAGTRSPEDPPPREKARGPWITGGLVLVLVLLAAAGFVFFGDRDDESAVDEIMVIYEVRGTGPEAAVTYLSEGQGMAQETGVALPWSKEVSVRGADRIVSMTAANGPGGGDITCRILVGGAVMTEQTSSGPYASASCSGDAGER